MTPEIILLSIFGSLLGKLLMLRTLTNIPKHKRPDVFSIAFFVSAFIDILLGVGFTYVQFRVAETMNVLLAVQISATAPLIASSILKSVPASSIYADASQEVVNQQAD